jgi:hypothetical protein
VELDQIKLGSHDVLASTGQLPMHRAALLKHDGCGFSCELSRGAAGLII